MAKNGKSKAITNLEQLLATEFSRRRAKNHRYSMRSFAAFLTLPVSTLKHILDGDRTPSALNLKKIAARMNWSEDLVKKLKFEIALEKKNRAAERDETPLFARPEDEIVADMATLAIRRLAELKRVPFDKVKIAEILGIPSSRVKNSLEILIAHSLVENNEGVLHPGKNQKLIFAQRPPSGALIKQIQQHLRHSETQLMTSDAEKLVQTAFYFFVRPQDIPTLIKKVNIIRRDLYEGQKIDDDSELYCGLFSIVPFRAT